MSTTSSWADALEDDPIDYDNEMPVFEDNAPTERELHDARSRCPPLPEEPRLIQQGNFTAQPVIPQIWLQHFMSERMRWEIAKGAAKFRNRKRAILHQAAWGIRPSDQNGNSINWLTMTERCPRDEQYIHFEGTKCHRCTWWKTLPGKNDHDDDLHLPINRGDWRLPISSRVDSRRWCYQEKDWVGVRHACHGCALPDPPKSEISDEFWNIGEIRGAGVKLQETEQVRFISQAPCQPKPLKQALPRISVARANPNDLNVRIPKRQHDGDAGYDLQTTEDAVIPAGAAFVASTGLAFKIPEGYYGQIAAKSGLAVAGLTVDGGVVDSGYRGEVKVILVNRNLDKALHIYAYDRIAQILFKPVLTNDLIEVDQISKETPRGEKGFGSTGVHFVKRHDMETLDRKKDVGTKMLFKLGSQLTSDQAQSVNKLMRKYESVLAVSYSDIQGSTVQYNHDIDIGNHPPIRKAPYRLSPEKMKWVDQEVATLKANYIIVDSNSPFSSPIVLVKKKSLDGMPPEWRMCVDFGDVNDVTVKDAYPIPRIIDILENMGTGVGYFTTLDCFAGYHQMGMTKRARRIAAFVTPHGHYEYLRMPFGLCNAPASFQRMMNNILKEKIGNTVQVYLDDIVIFTETFEEHMKELEEVLGPPEETWPIPQGPEVHHRS